MKVSPSKTQDFKKYSTKYSRSTRPLDYIYDPVYTFSGPKDYYKAANESVQLASQFNVQPIFESMFSDMVRYPRANLVLQPSHKIPPDIDTSYRGKLEAILQEKTPTVEVSGPDRYKYFRRPVTEGEIGSTSPFRFPLLVVENVTNLGIMAPPATAQKLRERTSASVQVRGIQTDFRESEAQTAPWTPPYTVCADTTPEVLHLDQLKWGKGLPPGMHEVEIIERLRMKQAWEEQLPPLDTKENIKQRYRLIEEMEKSDWEFREKEIEAIHEQRMKKSEQLLEQHVLASRTRLMYRMEFLEDEIKKRKEKKLELIQINKERALRKLCMKEKGYSLKRYKKSIVDEHLCHTSETYAPAKRNGFSFKNRSEQLADKHFTIDYRDLYSLKDDLEQRPGFDYNKASQPKKQTGLCVRETHWTLENLTNLHKELVSLRKKDHLKSDTFPVRAIELIPKSSKKSEIPSLTVIEDSDELYQAAILIQRVIHSRAMQSLMQQKLTCWEELMDELTSSDHTTSEQLTLHNLHKDKMNSNTRMVGIMKNIIGLNVGSNIGQTLNLLSAELLRFKNEGIAHDQAQQAESARWRLELPEAGRRQKEMIRREEHNLMFAELLEAYQVSVNEFLEKIVTRARGNEAKIQAYEYAKEMALLAELEEAERNKPDTEPITADLLFALIAPEGLRELARTCMIILKQKYVEAHQVLVDTGRANPLSDIGSLSETRGTTSAVNQLTTFDTATVEQSATYTPNHTLSEVMEEYYDEFDVAEASYQMATPSESPKPEEIETHEPENTEISESRITMITMPALARFGITTHTSEEDRLLGRIMRDMCYIAGSLLQTAAKILNKALQIAKIPRESFEEALRRTMIIIKEVQEEIFQMILPKVKFTLPSKIAPEEVKLEAAKIIEDIINKAKEKIMQLKKQGKHHIVFESDAEVQAKKLVDEVIKEAQHQVLSVTVKSFLSELFEEAQRRVAMVIEDPQNS